MNFFFAVLVLQPSTLIPLQFTGVQVYMHLASTVFSVSIAAGPWGYGEPSRGRAEYDDLLVSVPWSETQGWCSNQSQSRPFQGKYLLLVQVTHAGHNDSTYCSAHLVFTTFWTGCVTYSETCPCDYYLHRDQWLQVSLYYVIVEYTTKLSDTFTEHVRNYRIERGIYVHVCIVHMLYDILNLSFHPCRLKFMVLE